MKKKDKFADNILNSRFIPGKYWPHTGAINISHTLRLIKPRGAFYHILYIFFLFIITCYMSSWAPRPPHSVDKPGCHSPKLTSVEFDSFVDFSRFEALIVHILQPCPVTVVPPIPIPARPGLWFLGKVWIVEELKLQSGTGTRSVSLCFFDRQLA